MKKKMKKVLAYVLTVVMVCSLGMVIPKNAETVQAASKVRWSPDNTYLHTYKPSEGVGRDSTSLFIEGCKKQSEIKNLKSSDTSICKVEPKDGYVTVEFGGKAGKSTISCTVKGIKLKTVFTVKKYVNPLTTFKIGTSSFTSKFKTTDYYLMEKTIKRKTLSLKAKKGWVILSVGTNNKGVYRSYEVNKSSFSKKVTLTSYLSQIKVYMRQKSTGIEETIWLRKI